MPLTTYGWSGTCMSRLEAPPLATSMCGSSSHLLLCGKALRIMNAASIFAYQVMHFGGRFAGATMLPLTQGGPSQVL
jgi:hypothetical protein